jgi:hypothetical protein
MAEAWRVEDRQRFFLVLAEEFIPLVQNTVRTRFRLDDGACQDCADKVVDVAISFRDHHGEILSKPFPYLMTVAFNEARRIASENRPIQFHEDIANTGWEDGAECDLEDLEGETEMEDGRRNYGTVNAQMVFEDISEVEIRPEDQWWQEAMEAAIARLPIAPQRVIRHLLGEDFDFTRQDYAYNSKDAPRDLGMQPAAFRKNKERAYKGLREILPVVMLDMGLDFESRIVDVIFEQWNGPEE